VDALRIICSPRESLKQIYVVSFYRNAGYLMVNSGVSLVLGFVFWIVVARLYRELLVEFELRMPIDGPKKYFDKLSSQQKEMVTGMSLFGFTNVSKHTL
jgi:hypothetical protein